MFSVHKTWLHWLAWEALHGLTFVLHKFWSCSWSLTISHRQNPSTGL